MHIAAPIGGRPDAIAAGSKIPAISGTEGVGQKNSDIA